MGNQIEMKKAIEKMVRKEILSLQKDGKWRKLQTLHLKFLALAGDKRIGAVYPFARAGFSQEEVKFWKGVILMVKQGKIEVASSLFAK